MTKALSTNDARAQKFMNLLAIYQVARGSTTHYRSFLDHASALEAMNPAYHWLDHHPVVR